MNDTKTQRGFEITEFEDTYGAKWLIKAKIDNKIAELDLKVQKLLG